MKEVEIVGWYHSLNGHEFEQTPGDTEGQSSLMCCSPWDRRIGHRLNNKMKIAKMKTLKGIKIGLKSLKGCRLTTCVSVTI